MDAETVSARALSIADSSYESTDKRLADCLQNYADILHKLNRIVEAEQLEARADSIMSKQ